MLQSTGVSYDYLVTKSANHAKSYVSTYPGLATNSIFFPFPFCENSLICLEGVHVPRGAFNYWGSFNYSGALLIIWGALLIIQGHF